MVDESVTLSYSIDGDASYMKDRTVMIKLEPEHRGSFTFNISGDYPINVTLYDDELNEIETIQTKANGDKNVTFNSNIDNICHLRVDFINESHEGEISVSINPPCNGHMFDEYERYSLTHHRTFCSCGATGGLSPHVIKHADASFSTAPCILCGQLIFLDDTIVMVPGILNVCKVTLNGSYILPNGIVVLVDGDIEAYLNGTLVFYDVNNLPELQ